MRVSRPVLPTLAVALLTVLGCGTRNPAFLNGETDGGSGEGGSGNTSAPTTGSTSHTGGASHSGTNNPGSDDVTSASTEGDPVLEFVDDEWHGEFGDALVHQNVEWRDGAVRLELLDDAVGRLESRVFDAGAPIHWESIRWQPDGPYGIALNDPDEWNGDGYAIDDGISEAALQLLLNFEDGDFYDGAELVEQSGEDRSVRWNGSDASAAPARFAEGLRNNSGFGFADVSPQPAPGDEDFTWSLWFRSADCSGSTLMALDALNANSEGTFTTFIGCGAIDACDGDAAGQYATAWVEDPMSIARHRLCNPIPINDDAWHNIALRRTIAGGEEFLDLIVDGNPLPEASSYEEASDLSVHEDREDFTVAGGNELQYAGNGLFDQVAVWNRALTTGELKRLYMRGVQRVQMQVRACDDPLCANTPFRAATPDDTAFFVDPGPAEEHTIDLSDLDLHSRYFQYRLRLVVEEQSIPSPAIREVVIQGSE